MKLHTKAGRALIFVAPTLLTSVAWGVTPASGATAVAGSPATVQHVDSDLGGAQIVNITGTADPGSSVALTVIDFGSAKHVLYLSPVAADSSGAFATSFDATPLDQGPFNVNVSSTLGGTTTQGNGSAGNKDTQTLLAYATSPVNGGSSGDGVSVSFNEALLNMGGGFLTSTTANQLSVQDLDNGGAEVPGKAEDDSNSVGTPYHLSFRPDSPFRAGGHYKVIYKGTETNPPYAGGDTASGQFTFTGDPSLPAPPTLDDAFGSGNVAPANSDVTVTATSAELDGTRRANPVIVTNTGKADSTGKFVVPYPDVSSLPNGGVIATLADTVNGVRSRDSFASLASHDTTVPTVTAGHVTDTAAGQGATSVSGTLSAPGGSVTATLVDSTGSTVSQTVEGTAVDGTFGLSVDASGLARGTVQVRLVGLAPNGVHSPPVDTSFQNNTSVTAPAAPATPAATAGNTSAVVSFTAPSSGGSPITGYTVTSNPGGITKTGNSSPITVTGLSNGTAYTFTVTAANAVGTGPASPASNSVTPVTHPTLVLNPQAGSVIAGNALRLSGTLSGVTSGSRAVALTVTNDDGRVSAIATVTAGADGTFVFTGYRPTANGLYTTTYAGDAANAGAKSGARRTLVAPRIAVVSPVDGGSSRVLAVLAVNGQVTPNKGGVPIYLFRVNTNGTITRLSGVRIRSDGSYTLRRNDPRGTYRYQVRMPDSHGNAAASSKVFTVKRV